jgi:hypothetical protein
LSAGIAFVQVTISGGDDIGIPAMKIDPLSIVADRGVKRDWVGLTDHDRLGVDLPAIESPVAVKVKVV